MVHGGLGGSAAPPQGSFVRLGCARACLLGWPPAQVAGRLLQAGELLRVLWRAAEAARPDLPMLRCWPARSRVERRLERLAELAAGVGLDHDV